MTQGDMFRRDVPCSDARDPVERDESLSQFFTPSWAAELLVANALEGLGVVDVLEPSCGNGQILGAIPSTHGALGVEIDPRMAREARRRTGRDVVCGDFSTVDIGVRTFGAIIGNPPFVSGAIEALVARAHGLLPEGGVLGLVLPAHIPASSDRIARWRERFSIEVQLLPRMLFPRLRLPLTWTRMVRTANRTLVGVLLFDEQQDISAMPDASRRSFQAGRTWREVIGEALETLGGEASLRDIYAAVEPRRRSTNAFWRDKTRQILAMHYVRVDETRWRLAA